MTTTAFDPVTVISGAIDTLQTSLSGVAGPALGIGAGVLALVFGWGLVKRFIN